MAIWRLPSIVPYLPTSFQNVQPRTVFVAFDTTSNSGYQTISTYSWNHTCNFANRFLAVDISLLTVTGAYVLSVSYNGVPLTQIRSQTSVSGSKRIESWGLVNPAQGTHTIAIFLSTICDSVSNAVSYSGVHQSLPIEGINGAQATNVGAADATVTVTTIADRDWIHAACTTSDASITANQTERNNVSGASGSGANEDTGFITPPGATTVGYTNVGAGETWAIAAYALRPIDALNTSSVFLFSA